MRLSSVEAVRERVSAVLKPVTEQYNLAFTAFGDSLLTSSLGSVVISDASNNSLEPSPRTPTDHSAPWILLSSSIRTVIEESGAEQAKKKVSIFLLVFSSKGLLNEDHHCTRHYDWK